jgi:hypothetical protein
VPESNTVSALILVVPLFPLNRTILPAFCLTYTGVLAKKAPIRGSTLTNKATEKSHILQPQDQESPDNRQGKPCPASKPERVGRSFEPGSCVRNASDLHPKKQYSQITSTDERM